MRGGFRDERILIYTSLQFSSLVNVKGMETLRIWLGNEGGV